MGESNIFTGSTPTGKSFRSSATLLPAADQVYPDYKVRSANTGLKSTFPAHPHQDVDNFVNITGTILPDITFKS